MRPTTILLLVCLMTSPALAQSIFSFTSNEDFDQGLQLNVNYDVPDQLQWNLIPEPLPYISVANIGRGTVTRVNTTTGDVVGEYRTAPEGFSLSPSRSTADLLGNVWTGNRNEIGLINDIPHGSVVKTGLVTGGTRVNSDGSPNDDGGFLAGPFGYNTCLDRDGDGLIRTSRGLLEDDLPDILPWVNVTDGLGGADGTGNGLVEDATDECILCYQRTPDADRVTHVSIDQNNNVWAGGYPGTNPHVQASFVLLDGDDGQLLDSFDARRFGAGGYGGLVDGNGILWSASYYQNNTLRYDPVTDTGIAIPITRSYGMGVDFNGDILNTQIFADSFVKMSPDGVVQPGYPKPTGAERPRGIAVTPVDNHIWVAHAGRPDGGTIVSRLDNDGNVLKLITVGTTPVGVAVDAEGKVWAVNRDSSNLMRIDPNGGVDGLGAVDMTVELGSDATPYTYSDMTGMVVIGNTSPQGNFTLVQDGAEPGLEWDQILWNTEPEGSVPPGTSITVEARAGDNLAALPGIEFLEVGNGASLDGQISGRYLEVRTILRPFGDLSPVLSDLLMVSLPVINCDFSGDGLCDVTDLDLMQSLGPLAPGVPAAGNEAFDLNGDGIIDLDDRNQWLAEAAVENSLGSPYKLGDADLDSFVDGLDFIAWNANKFTANLLWSVGDFNSDGVIDGEDFLHWNANKFTSSDGLAAVPEPGTGLLSIVVLILLAAARMWRYSR